MKKYQHTERLVIVCLQVVFIKELKDPNELCVNLKNQIEEKVRDELAELWLNTETV